MIKFITAPNLVDVKDNDIVIFLAGPIQGAGDWHKECFELLKKEFEAFAKSYENLTWKPNIPDIYVFSPKRDAGIEKSTFEYKEQVRWETIHLNLAGRQGVVVFWFANEETQVYETNGKLRPFGKTSRFEFAEWKTRHDLGGAKVVLGLDIDWQKEKYFLERIEQDGSDIPVCYLIEDVVRQTVKQIFNL